MFKLIISDDPVLVLTPPYLDNVQIIKENEQAKFAVIPFAEFLELQALLSNPDKLADYLDYLHMQQVKAKNPAWLSLVEVKAAVVAQAE